MKNLFFGISILFLSLGLLAFFSPSDELITLDVDLHELVGSGIMAEDLISQLDLEAVSVEKNEIALGEMSLRNHLAEGVFGQIMNPELDEYSFYPQKGKFRIGYYNYVRQFIPKGIDSKSYYDFQKEKNRDDRKSLLRSYIITRLDRSPDQLYSRFLTYQGLIYSIIPPSFYHGSVLSDYTETLIAVYEELQKEERLESKMNSLYQKLNDLSGFCSVAESHGQILGDLVSDQTKEKFDDTYDLCTLDPVFNDANWFYSFWVRRYHEGNAEAVYTILKEIKDHYKKVARIPSIPAEEMGEVRDLSPASYQKYKEGKEIADKIGREELDYNKLSAEQAELFDYYEDKEIIDGGFYTLSEFFAGGCSFASNKASASSTLPPNKSITYEAKNLTDRDLRTAWVEGLEGYGIGASFSYPMEMSRRETKNLFNIAIYNGYAKSPLAWKNNSRVKTLRLFCNDYAVCDLELEDNRKLQHFDVREFRFMWGNNPVFRFEILDVYKGAKYDDTALSELAFGYIGCQCFAAGTLISMEDGSQKPIEQIKEGDRIMSYNFQLGRVEPAQVLDVNNPVHDGLSKLTFADGTQLTTTKDHPFWTSRGWASLNPGITNSFSHIEQAGMLEEGSVTYRKNGLRVSPNPIKHIDDVLGARPTYTITRLTQHHAFFANDILVGIE
ncbi:MAG: hypothetical protein AAFY71_03490 [Bacteroidota bacterium]